MRRAVRSASALLVLLAFLGVPSSAAPTEHAFSRLSLGSLTAPVVRTYAVPPGALLLGVTWTAGAADVSVRRGLGAWEAVENDPLPGPRQGTEPFWIGSGVSAVTVRVVPRTRASDASVDFVGGSASPSSSSAPATRSLPRLGSVVTRPGWGADERLRSGSVSYTTPTAVVVHHTVTTNDYTQAQAASYIRAVYAYHTRSRGWSDIGYNLLVDRFGTVYEGRYGDFARGVVGAHTAGFNSGTIGVSLLGNYDAADTPAAVTAALGRVGAWASERWRFDPRGRVTLTSAGSPRFRAGTRVTVSRMPGHRDLGQTACPGRYAYGRLPAVRNDAWRRLRAVLSKAVVTGAPVRSPDPVTVKATIDHAAWWVATISTSDGQRLARAIGHGTRVAVSWDGVLPNGLPAMPGTSYTYRVTADDHLHGASDPRSGSFEAGMPHLLP